VAVFKWLVLPAIDVEDGAQALRPGGVGGEGHLKTATMGPIPNC